MLTSEANQNLELTGPQPVLDTTAQTGMPPTLATQTGAAALQADSQSWGHIRDAQTTGAIHIGQRVISKESQVYDLIHSPYVLSPALSIFD